MLKFAHKNYEDLTPQQRTQIDECVTAMLRDNTPIDALREATLLSVATKEIIVEARKELTEVRKYLKRVEEIDKEIAILLSDDKDPTEE